MEPAMAETQITSQSTPPNPSTPAAPALSKENLHSGKFPGDRAAAFRVFVDQKVHAELSAHAKEKSSVEICGVLVGSWQQDERGPFVAITNSIRGDAATSKFAEVTFTH